MLELIKKNIHMDCIKAKAADQITIEDDVNIPDLRPDIDKVIFQSGIIRFSEVKAGTDQVFVKGTLAVHILYLSEEEEEPVSKIETELPFEQVFHMDNVSASDNICVRQELEDLSIGVINSRKISVRALLNLELFARAVYDEIAAIDVNTDLPTEYQKKPINVLETTVCRKDIFRFRHEETLPSQMPNILEVLYGAVIPMDMECTAEDGKLMLHGNVRLFFLYVPDDEGGNQFYENIVPVRGEVSCSGLMPQMIPNVTITVSDTDFEVKEDYDGEDRVFDIETLFDLDIKAYEEKTYDVLSDIYCVSKEIKTECKDTPFLQLLSHKQARIRVKERIDLDVKDLVQLIHHEEIVHPEDFEIEDGKLNIVGNMQLRLLYSTGQEQDGYRYAERDIPFYYSVDDIDLSNVNVHQDISMQISQADISVLDAGTMECNAIINMKLLLMEEKKERIIVDAEVSDFLPDKIKNLPGMVIYVVKEGDSLWKIGKEYCICVDEIKELNGLTKDDIYPGDRLLLMKNMKCIDV